MVPGAARSPLADVSVDELIRRLPPAPARPLQVTRFPVTMEEYYQLTEEAQAPEAADEADEDEGMEAAVEVVDPPEGEGAVAPEAAAPAVTRSFAGIPQTAFRPLITRLLWDPITSWSPSTPIWPAIVSLGACSLGGPTLPRCSAPSCRQALLC